MPDAPERRVLFKLNWHVAVLCAGLACLGVLTILVPWKNHYGTAIGYHFIWSTEGHSGTSVDLTRQIMPMLFFMLATGVGVYLTKGLAPWPINAPEPAPQFPQQPIHIAAPEVVSLPSDVEPVDQPGIGPLIAVLLIAVLAAGIFISVVAFSYNGERSQDEKAKAVTASVR